MPMLVYTIGDYFAKYRKDLYFIRFHNATDENWDELPERKMLCDWFRAVLPNIKTFPIVEMIEKGAFSVAYNGSIGILFDDESLNKFVECWEDGNDSSVDPRFQCFFMPFEVYVKMHGEESLETDDEMI